MVLLSIIYGIYKYKRRYVHFYVIANHEKTINHAIDNILSEGFLLSQITFIHNPSARLANITYDYSTNRICVEWVMKDSRIPNIINNASQENNLGVLVKQFSGL